MENPYNINIERSVLSSILFEPSMLEEAKEALRADDFYLPFHKHVYSAMIALDKSNKPIDEEFLAKVLKSNNAFDEAELLEILATNPLPNIQTYTKELIDKAGQRKLVNLSQEIIKQVSEDREVSEIGSEIVSLYDELVNRTVKSEIFNTADFVNSFEDEMQKVKANNGSCGVRTGITALDNLTGGFEAGELVIVAGRPAMGKTAVGTTIANNCDLNGVGVLFDSLEMSGAKIVRRLIANRANESLGDLKRGLCRYPTSYNQALEDIKSSKNIILNSMYYPTIEQLCAKAKRTFRAKPNIKIWIIDHLKHIKMKSSNSFEISNERGEQLKQIIKIAKEHDVVPLVLHQLNRGNENQQNKRPNLSHLGQSSAIEELASWVIFPYRESYYEAKDKQIKEKDVTSAEMIISKARDGETGIANCFFCGKYSRFQNEPMTTYMEKVIYEMPSI